MIACALDEVQIISLNAFIPAEQLMYVITIWSGYLSLNILKSSGGAESANEQPAFKSGNKIFFCGFKIFAVSAIKCTPAKTIISAWVDCAFCASPRLSPI